MSWTDDRVNLLKKLWGEGKTAAEIAKALGGVTRNAVIGKAHRLKLSGRVSPIQQNKNNNEQIVSGEKKSAAASTSKIEPEKKPEKSAPPRKTVKVANQNTDVMRSITASGQKISLADLEGRMCRWPIGDPKEADFGFCGGASMSGLPYCTEHAKLAYQAATRNRILKNQKAENTADTAAGTKTKKAVG